MDNWEEIVKDLETDMSIRAIARKHSVNYSTLHYKLKKAGLIGKDKPNLITKGESTLYDEDGNVKLKWVKTDKEKDDVLDNFVHAVESYIEDRVEGIWRSPETAISCSEDTMTVYTVGDAHIGMLAEMEESGNTNNLQTTESDLMGAMQMLVEQSVDSHEALIVDVGDWFHSDNSQNRTAHSGNALDVDGRYHTVLRLGLSMAVRLIELALTRHAKVTWRSAIGNHNEHSAIMMSMFIEAWFKNEPRVEVASTSNMFYYKQFGKNLIGITHGHTCKAEKLGEVMSVDCKNEWSSTENRYWYTGHIHHQSVKEFSNCVVETFRTLSGKDAWHSASGYRSKQDMKAITLHKEYGEISRNTVSLAMVRA